MTKGDYRALIDTLRVIEIEYGGCDTNPRTWCIDMSKRLSSIGITPQKVVEDLAALEARKVVNLNRPISYYFNSRGKYVATVTRKDVIPAKRKR